MEQHGFSLAMNNKPVNHSKEVVSCCSTWNLQKDETNNRNKLTKYRN
jgi:hypothetical protein